ncbi:MAG TPA: hypothetical protein VFS39_15405 [Nitrospira sp.]|nr:hypothetical protein [Nitrospira sp.]
MRNRWLTVALVLLGNLAAPWPVFAQLMQGIPRSPMEMLAGAERPPQGLYIMPWVAAGVVYDSNVFFRSRDLGPQDDVFLRVTPGLQASYQSTPLTVVANYRFDAEEYSHFHTLSTVQQRQFGTVELRYRPSVNWNLSNTLGYAQTRTPFELNFLTSAQVARIKTERYFVSPAAEYRIDPYTRLRGEYAFSKDIFGGQVDINSHIFTLGMERRLGAHDTIGPGYIGRHFTFSGDFNTPIAGFLGGNPNDVNSHAFVVNWAHEFAAGTRLDVRAGPRFTNGGLDDRPEALVGLRRRIQNGELGLTYTSAITTVIGTVGSTRTDNVTLTALYEPVKHFTLTAAPTVAWIKNSTFSSTIYTAYVEAAYQFNKFVTAKGSAYFSHQESELTGSSGTFVIPRNVFWFRVELTYPTRWED